MAVETEKEIEGAISLLRDDNIQAADDALTALKASLQAEREAREGTTTAAPREPNEILLDFGRALVTHLGSPPGLVALLAEYQAAHKQA